MRVWDFPPKYLCQKHLLGQHNEIHTIYNVYFKERRGWRNHPEVKRWAHCIEQLVEAHDDTACEMIMRGYNHRTPLDFEWITHAYMGGELISWESLESQLNNLIQKECACDISGIQQYILEQSTRVYS